MTRGDCTSIIAKNILTPIDSRFPKIGHLEGKQKLLGVWSCLSLQQSGAGPHQALQLFLEVWTVALPPIYVLQKTLTGTCRTFFLIKQLQQVIIYLSSMKKSVTTLPSTNVMLIWQKKLCFIVGIWGKHLKWLAAKSK